METMQPSLKRGRDYWDQINMPTAEFQERVEKIRKEMKKEGIEVLLLYGRSINEYGNPCYVSNFVTGSPRAALIAMPQKGEIALIFEGFVRGLPTAKSRTWIEDVRVGGDVSKLCVQYLKEKKFIPSTIGFVGFRQLMPYDQLQFLQESTAQCKIVDSNQMIRDMRMIKSQRECDQIHRSSRIVMRAFDSISKDLPSNMNERIVASIMEKAAFMEGAEDFRMLLARPIKEKWSFRPAEDGQILIGDTIIVYLAVEFERYWSEGIRTFVAADASSLVPTQSDNAYALYEGIMAGMKPGKAVSQFYKEIVNQIQKSPFDYIPEYGLGQGIGLSLHEFPVITDEDSNLLKEGMCLTLRLAIRDKEMGAVMIGNTIHLSKDGPEVLTK